jgi:outer membrane receptor for ferrienterochelin and colicin
MKKIFSKNKQALLLLVFLLLSCGAVNAQGRGKIAGVITDKQTGEALIGANVMIKGTNMGGAADIDGKFFIIGVPPGTYELQASFIGYHPININGVNVKIDLTTKVDIELTSAAIETQVVEVMAHRTLVQKDVTATRKTVDRETISSIPGFESAADVFRLQGGTVLGNTNLSMATADGTQLQVRDESVKDVHIRGGRGGEILFMVDGVPVNHPLYGGREVLDLNVVAVEQVELITGGFSAEYGQAQSGVVNVTTRSGSDKFKGGFEYKTDELGLFGENYNTQIGSVYLSGPEPITRSLLPLLGVTVPGKLSFFLSANATLTNTAYNNNRTRQKISLFGIDINERQDNSQNVNGKLSWDINKDIRTAFSFNGSWKDWTSFEWDWKDAPDNRPRDARDNVNMNFLLNHFLSPRTYYSLNLGYLGIGYNQSYNNMSPDEFWTWNDTVYATTIISPKTNQLTGFYDKSGILASWRDDNTKSYTAKFDFTSQFHPEHLLKAGFEAQYHDISFVDITDGAYVLSDYGKYRFQGAPYAEAPDGPYPEYGQNRWVFNAYPIIGGFYVQEKFEKEFIIINAGLRSDFFWLGQSVNDQEWKRKWREVTKQSSDWEWYKIKFSPRFGISFPIMEQTVVFFSYGHFYQLPEMQYFYRDPYSGTLVGNPKLDYEQTILYEFGFTHQLFDDFAIDIKTYAKDISQQLGQITLTGVTNKSGQNVTMFDNISYARARGLEFEFTKTQSNFTSGKLTYTIQWADGYSSSSIEDYIRSQNDFPNPIRERRLSWDVRHQLILQAVFAAGPGQYLNLFGFELPDDWNLTILANMSSGSPYTPGTTDAAERQKKENINSGPITTSADLQFSKGFNVLGANLRFLIDIYNLFDQNNVVIDSRWFNSWTGEPYRYGDLMTNTNKYYDYYSMVKLRDPRQFTTGRYAKIGIRVDF